MSDKCQHKKLVWDIGQAWYCEECEADAKTIIGELARERDEARAEVARLRALCAARPRHTMAGMEYLLVEWCQKIDAAGRGDG